MNISERSRMQNEITLPSPMSWDDYFFEIAQTVAKKSKDPSTKVGAVLVDTFTHELISSGYNGFPRGMGDSVGIWMNRDANNDYLCKYDCVIHAEINAILTAQQPLINTSLYCTHPTCLECAKIIAASGICIVNCLAGVTVMDLKHTKVTELFKRCDVSYNIRLTSEKPSV